MVTVPVEEISFAKLRDCFTGGYTFPQFCIDNGIKKPLFVSEQKFLLFMWEIHVQFCYDKRLAAQFSLIEGAKGFWNGSVHCILDEIEFKSLGELTLDDCDAIICLTSKKISSSVHLIYLDELVDHFIRKTYCEIPLLHFLQRNPKVCVIVTNFPVLTLNGVLPEREHRICSKNIHQVHDALKVAKEKIPTPYDFLGYTNSEVYELLEMTGAKINPDGSTTLKDCSSSLIGIREGKRLTIEQPEKFLNKIYFMGTCTFFGIGAPFDKTIESYLQKIFNEHNLPYRVENESQFFAFRYQDIFYNLNNLPAKPGDIIFLCLQELVPFSVPFVDIKNIFNDYPNHAIFFTDTSHLNELGYKILAEKFFKFLTENNFFHDVEFNYHTPPPNIS